MSVKVTEKGITKYLSEMLKRAQKVDGWLNRVGYREIIRVQRKRWQTENKSEGKQWKPLKTEKYKRLKLRKYRDYPGGGRKLLIATARLVQSMTGDEKRDHYKLVIKSRLEVGTFVPYAKYVQEQRDIVGLSSETKSRLKKDLKDYLTGKSKK